MEPAYLTVCLDRHTHTHTQHSGGYPPGGLTGIETQLE